MSNFVGFMIDILYRPYVVPLFLIAVGIYFTIRTKCVQVRMFGEMFKVVSEKPADEKVRRKKRASGECRRAAGTCRLRCTDVPEEPHDTEVCG